MEGQRLRGVVNIVSQLMLALFLRLGPVVNLEYCHIAVNFIKLFAACKLLLLLQELESSFPWALFSIAFA